MWYYESIDIGLLCLARVYLKSRKWGDRRGTMTIRRRRSNSFLAYIPLRLGNLFFFTHMRSSLRHSIQSQPNDAHKKQLDDHSCDSESGGLSSSSTDVEESEFDWDHDEEAAAQPEKVGLEAKRGRWAWKAFMKLSRPVRVITIALLGLCVVVTPLIVVNVKFASSASAIHIHLWSLWLTLIWAAGCGTYLLVDAIPLFVLAVTSLFGGQVEQMKIRLEVRPLWKASSLFGQ